MVYRYVTKYYYCVGCGKVIHERNIVYMDHGLNKGFCRNCFDKYDSSQRNELLKYGYLLLKGEQLSLLN